MARVTLWEIFKISSSVRGWPDEPKMSAKLFVFATLA